MIKLQDFARECGVTDRAIQKHLKTYAAELEGLYERKGPNGTWLSDEACEILRSKMKTQPVMIYDAESNERLLQLEEENMKLREMLSKAQEHVSQAQERLSAAQEQLLETKGAQARLEASESHREALQAENEALRAENDSFEPWLFGLWRKKR